MQRYKKLHRQYQKLTTKSLIDVALNNLQFYSEEFYICAIYQLQTRANPQTVAILQKLFKSRNWRKRVVAINIISQMCIPKRPFPHYAVKEAQNILAMAIKDTNINVVIEGLYGISFRKTDEALSNIISLANHDNRDVRRAVVSALYSFSEKTSIQTLIKLAIDMDDYIREYATFGLGQIHADVDMPEVRDRLFLNCDDHNHYVADDALAGLIYREDPRAFDLLQKRLTRVEELNNCIEYAISETKNLTLAKLLDIELE